MGNGQYLGPLVSVAWRTTSHAAATLHAASSQYLAFIYGYGRIFKQPPAEAEMRRHFEVTAPTVHQMVLNLEKAGLITRVPGAARSIQLRLPPEALPILR